MVRPFPVLNVLSVLIVVFALAMLLPLCVSLGYGDAARNAYENAVLITFVSGAILWVVTRSRRGELQTRDGFLLVALRAAVAGRNGNHRPRGGDPAAARDRREPDHEDGDPGTDEGHPAYSTHHRNRQRPVAGLRGDDARVRFGFQGGGDGLVRCRG